MSIRRVIESDWPSIMSIQADCYHEITPESLEVMQSKWQVSPDTCWVYEHQGQVSGYILTHAWKKGDAPKLDSVLTHQNNGASINATSHYIHDMAVSPQAQGLGIAKKLVQQLINFCQNHDGRGIGLVAIQGADDFWQRFGFDYHTDTSVGLTRALESYGNDACYMYLNQ
ncbi:GNAT family N-acetyltransferase [Shewanella gaetbuli]|uniref:GNAT family N-acetyltransferase n=1 Tax=Shewanella gaetbuli TaxID=220752 RepID=A0A9X1ZLH5_9GAMM|nr:GNAT family N-acetyltransferase [Shewanella gaetbuli]MCL1141862.1 GNAT family N-acetyltransferase [Shewanella gaetbuli]